LVKTNPIQTPSNPMSEKPKMNANIFITKDYENEPPKGSEKTNPIKPCPERSRMGQFQTRRRFFCLCHLQACGRILVQLGKDLLEYVSRQTAKQ